MIVFDLICSDGHRFESWFRNGAAYEDQSQRNAIACPVCGDSAVGKAPVCLFVARHGTGVRAGSDAPPPASPPSAGSSAPAVPSATASEAATSESPSSPAPLSAATPAPPAAEEALRALRTVIEASCVDVGGAFAEEARRIHYGETEQRNIYGEASADEASALREEGIAIQALPWMRRRHD